uniref:ZAD domain-containing protein n=1 Tax=Anopheles minimus TaxID=112268 RepID=A0A182WDR4_9DIPT
MSSSASSSTAGSNAAGAAATNPSGQSGEVGSGTDGSGHANSGPGGNIVAEKQQSGGGGVGHPGTTEPRTSSPAHHRNGSGGVVGTGGNTTSTTGTVLRRKTNVCLICGIYTNLSLNIFEPRNGPNIVDVIYEKYKFRAERGDTADKHICFSCNNWLINWYSLQNTSSGSSRTCEPAPSTSRSSSAADSSNNSRHGRHHSHKPRTKSHYRHVSSADSTNDKENRPQKRHQQPVPASNPDQHGQISSTTSSSPAEDYTRSHHYVHPYAKQIHRSFASPRRSLALKEKNGQRAEAPASGWKSHQDGCDFPTVKQDSDNAVSSSTENHLDPYTILIKPFESRLIQMLQGQGTSVTKESVSPGNTRPWTPRVNDTANGNNVTVVHRTSVDGNGNIPSVADDDDTKEIVISFDTALSEVIDVVPSLKAIQSWNIDPVISPDPVRSLHQRLSSGALTVSVIDGTGTTDSCVDQ